MSALIGILALVGLLALTVVVVMAKKRRMQDWRDLERRASRRR